MEDYTKIYQEWLSDPYLNEDTEAELRATEGDENGIKEYFCMDLELRTAGLCGVIDAGTNRMNIYVVRRATQGLTDYIIRQGGADKSMAIAYNSRHMFPEFAMEVAMTLTVNGVKAHKFESLHPAPELFFVVRELGCAAGTGITANHNPPEYNGYKVYWEDGTQFIPPRDKSAAGEVLAIEDLSTVKTTDKASAAAAGKYEATGKEIDGKYIAQAKAQVMNQKVIGEMQSQINTVYTPPRDTGNILTRRVMRELRFIHVYVVPKQELPDGDFPTVSYPDPETAEVFALGLKLAREKDADLALATSSDADRLGVYVKDAVSGEYIPLIGNMSSSLLCEYVLNQKKVAGRISEDGQAIKFTVSANLIDAITREYGCELVEVLTGFKQMGQQALKNEKTGHGIYLFSVEEGYGCLIGTYARDRDAISATAALCEAAAYYKQKGMTLRDAIVVMYEKYSYYKDAIKPIGLSGIEGLAEIQPVMGTLRNNTPKEVGDYKVVSARDYKLDTIKDMAIGEVELTDPPLSNVLYYDLSDGAWTCVRPSGAESKTKFYYGIKGSSMEDADVRSEALGAAAMAMVDKMIQ